MTRAASNPGPKPGLDTVFPYKTCINLDRRPDRWEQMQLKFARHGIRSVRRFRALDGGTLKIPAGWVHTPGAYGCLLSHLQVVREARRLGVSEVLIFEDDVVFDSRLQTKFAAYIKQLPADWDMLFFGALHKDEPIRISQNIARISKANSTYAYALRQTVFDAFIRLNSKAEAVLDINTFVLQQQFNCYCFMPHLAWVETDYSDAQEHTQSHWYLKESLVLFGPGADRLLNDTTIVFAHRDQTEGGPATQNLLYLVRYYNEFFSSQIAMVIVEQGANATLDRAALPQNCKYVLLRDAGPFSRARCFSAGIRCSDPNRKFVILSDNDVFLETLDIRANLRMCEQYDCASGFSKIIDLTGEDSLRLRTTNGTRGINIAKSALQENDGRPGYCCFFNRESIRPLEGWVARGDEGADPLLHLKSNRKFRVFRSPNHALRLQQV
ncbi:MAG TPA: glycosyltransferase family 25 protein [Blastocatellia bacterium]|nr:glycosyltransferase family 25 protein [Blastocatellia bacterium]